MTDILHRIGKYNKVARNDPPPPGAPPGSPPQPLVPELPCLAACEDQLNLVTETSSSFPNSETFHRRREFCLVAEKLIGTCSTKKAGALTKHFPSGEQIFRSKKK